jgi:hypothetical protein
MKNYVELSLRAEFRITVTLELKENSIRQIILKV